MQNVPNKIIVHHSADASPYDQLTKINEYHRIRDFYKSSLGYYVGYHYLIEKSGKVVTTRAIADEGCHTIGQNLQSIGVCLAGDFSVELPTKSQEQSLARLLVGLCDAEHISYLNIKPHRSFSNTSCFGNKLSTVYPIILCLKEKLAQLLSR